jgi:SAM-dependent methyltransferase
VSDEAQRQPSPADRYIGRDDPREAERLATQGAGGLNELRDALRLCALPEQPRVLEMGCGSGVFTQSLLEALPDAHITATDLNERLLAEARRVLGAAAQPGGRVRLERADAGALPYAARSFDLVACRFVLMHQADPAAVAGEMHRVAALGGFALAIEPDWGARALYPDAEALAALQELARRGRAHGFPDVFIGRKLYALLRAAGFAPVWVRPAPLVATADDVPHDSAQPDAPLTLGPERLLEQSRRLLRASGLASDHELDELIARLTAIPRSQDFFSAGMDFAAVGLKPSAPSWP